MCHQFCRSVHEIRCQEGIQVEDPQKLPCSSSATAVLKSPAKKRRKQWSDESTTAAIEAVKKKDPKVAMLHGVPRTTLQDRFHGKVVLGPKPHLVLAEEMKMSLFLVDVVQVGYGMQNKAAYYNHSRKLTSNLAI